MTNDKSQILPKTERKTEIRPCLRNGKLVMARVPKGSDENNPQVVIAGKNGKA
jgi:hypothetical protein